MSLNLCRRNLEDQFLFPTCQGRLHALLPPGFAVEENWGSWSKRRSSLSPMVDVGDWTHFLFVFFVFLSPSATVEASKPPSGNSAAFRRWSSSRRHFSQGLLDFIASSRRLIWLWLTFCSFQKVVNPVVLIIDVSYFIWRSKRRTEMNKCILRVQGIS